MKPNDLLGGACALLICVSSASAALPPLDTLDDAVAAQKATLANPKASAQAKAEAQLKLYEIDILTGPDAAFEAKRKELEAYLTHPIDGFKPAQQIDFLKQLYRRKLTVKLPSSYELAESFVKNLGAEAPKYATALRAYRIESMRGQVGTLEKTASHEARLDLIDASLKDSAMSGIRPWLQLRRLEALSDLGRDVEAEAYGLELVGLATNRAQKLEASAALGDFYLAHAKRYCAKPDPTGLVKAAGQYRIYVVAAKGDDLGCQRMLHKIASCLRDADDAKGAKAALDEEESYVSRIPEARRASVRFGLAMMRGDLAFDAGDFASALREWEPHAKAILTEGGRDGAKLERYCRALKATGRTAEMMPYMEALSKRGNKYTRLRYEYLLGVMKGGQGK